MHGQIAKFRLDRADAPDPDPEVAALVYVGCAVVCADPSGIVAREYLQPEVGILGRSGRTEDAEPIADLYPRI